MTERINFEEKPFEGGFALEDDFGVLAEEEYEDDDLETLFEPEGDLDPLGFEA